MGISRGMIKLLMREGKREKYLGSVLTAGRQDIFATAGDLLQWAQEMDYVLRADFKMHLSDKEDIKEKNIADQSLFLALGFDKCESIDYSDYEGCSVVYDLNKDIPIEYYNKYDLIFDGGTSEHIFNLPKVLENYNKMLKVGGRIIHALPSSNHVDHGFYMFSPTLFTDYYSSNHWDIKDSLFIQFSQKHDKELWNIYSYKPGCLDKFSFGGFNKGMFCIYFVARKTKESSYDADVQQNNCKLIWDNCDKKMCKKSVKNKIFLQRISNLLPFKLKEIIRPYYKKLLIKDSLQSNLELIAKY